MRRQRPERLVDVAQTPLRRIDRELGKRSLNDLRIDDERARRYLDSPKAVRILKDSVLILDEALTLDFIGDGAFLLQSAHDTVKIDVGRPYMHQRSATNANNPSTTNTATYVTALGLNWTGLPDGTYDIFIDGSVLISNGAGNDTNIQINLGGTIDGTVTIAVLTETVPHTRAATEGIFSNYVVSGGAGIDPLLEYKGTVGNTTYVKNPVIRGWAIRKA